ncbi:MAG: hypothetical protein QF541_23330 [Lentisphaeria bacterium]|nr:hypothetical protein [Lentisphaeria bacterium]
MNDPNGTFFWQGRYHLSTSTTRTRHTTAAVPERSTGGTQSPKTSSTGWTCRSH